METKEKNESRKYKSNKFGPVILGLPINLWLLIIVLAPIVIMFIMSFKTKSGYEILNTFTFENYLEFFQKPIYWRILLKSFRMSFIVSIAAILVSYPLAYFISRKLTRFKNLLYMLIITPLWVSYLVRIIAWRTILGNQGFVNTILMKLQVIKEPLSILLYNQGAVIIVLTYISIPFVFIPLYTSLEKIPDNLIDASRDLGANEFKTLKNVILPITSPGLFTGFMLSFIIALGDYIIPMQLGGKTGIMYGNLVYSQFGIASNWVLGAALGFILFFIATIVFVIAQKFGSREGVLVE